MKKKRRRFVCSIYVSIRISEDLDLVVRKRGLLVISWYLLFVAFNGNVGTKGRILRLNIMVVFQTPILYNLPFFLSMLDSSVMYNLSHKVLYKTHIYTLTIHTSIYPSIDSTSSPTYRPHPPYHPRPQVNPSTPPSQSRYHSPFSPSI